MYGAAGDPETITVLRPSGTDRFGNTLPGPTFDVPGCLFAPGASAEPGVAAEQVRTDATVYAPDGVDIRSTDRIQVRGATFAVVGDVAHWVGHGTVIELNRITG